MVNEGEMSAILVPGLRGDRNVAECSCTHLHISSGVGMLVYGIEN